MHLLFDIILSGLRLTACIQLAYKNKSGWLLTILANTIKIIILPQVGLSVLASSKLLTSCISLFAWRKWYQYDRCTQNPPRWTFSTTWQSITMLTLLIPLVFFSPVSPALQSYASFLNLLGYFTASYQKRTCWAFWLVYDIALIYLFLHTGLYLSALTTCLYIPIALLGQHHWKVEHQPVEN